MSLSCTAENTLISFKSEKGVGERFCRREKQVSLTQFQINDRLNLGQFGVSEVWFLGSVLISRQRKQLIVPKSCCARAENERYGA